MYLLRMKKVLLFLKILLIILLGLPLLYLLAAFIGFIIPVNSGGETGETAEESTRIFLVSNGIHVDIAVPYQSSQMDWTGIVEYDHPRVPQPNARYLSIGWGDLGFYTTTPEWEDLTFDTAFTALFEKSPAALHVTFHRFLEENEHAIAVDLSKEQYKKLVQYLLNTFKPGEDGEIKPIPGLHYDSNDAFYPAKGTFTLFRTCNTWTNNGLKYAGLEASLWTPFEEGIFWRYR